MKIYARLGSCLLVFPLLIAGIAAIPEQATAQITVTLATPSSATPGTINLNVVVNGSGFKKGAKAHWFVTGTTNPGGVTVNSTTFNNSSQLTANITVSSTADIANFDVQVVNSDGRTGEGTELFAVVTQQGTGPLGSCTQLALAAPGLYPMRDYCSISGAGCFDTSFGSGGFVISPSVNQSVAIKMQGSQILAFTPSSGASVARFNSDGTLDTTFGTNGITFVTSVPVNGPYIQKLVVQPDGYILVMSGSVLARLTPNGQFDTSFGTAGIVQLSSLSAGALALQSDGKIFAGGSNSTGYWAIARLTPSGSIDQTFGNKGTAIFNPGTKSNSAGNVMDLVVQKVLTVNGVQERVVGGGYIADSTTSDQYAMARLLPNGTLDSTFGASSPGILRFNFGRGGGQGPYGLAIDSANRLVMGGQVEYYGCLQGVDYAIMRATPNGASDTSFGDIDSATGLRTGMTHVNFYGNTDHQRGLAVDALDRPLAVGTAKDQFGTLSLALVRLNTDGTFDGNFGDHGGEVLDFGTTSSAGSAITIQSDGRIIVTGGQVVARLQP